jgi:hypothetical protein
VQLEWGRWSMSCQGLTTTDFTKKNSQKHDVTFLSK